MTATACGAGLFLFLLTGGSGAFSDTGSPAEEKNPAPAAAPPIAETPKPAGVAPGVSVSVWATGLHGPQGLAFDDVATVYVVENGANRVARFDKNGKALGVLAEGLKAPAFALVAGNALFVGERDGNAVARIDTASGAVRRLAGQIVDPLGLCVHPNAPRNLFVVSHRQSVVHQFAYAPLGTDGVLRLLPAAFVSAAPGAKYGWRDLCIGADGTLYVTDELTGGVLRRRPGQDGGPWVKGLSSPSGLAEGPRGVLYVTEEGNGGRLSRLDPETGTLTLLASGLGKAREVIFLEPTTLLVSDRGGGTIYKITLPQATTPPPQRP